MASPISKAFGELDLTFIGGSAMSEAWWDKGSGGKHDGAYYNPDFSKLGSAYDGFYFLGSFGMSSYQSPTGPMLLVRAGSGSSSGKPALKPAEDFTQIWTDKGSGADQDGSFWLPTCSDADYVPLGTLGVRGHGKPNAESSRIALVRKDLTTSASIGAFIWDDSGTGSDRDFGSWAISIASVFIDPTKMQIAPGCFVGVASHTKPNSAVQANVLLLPFPTVHNETPFVPSLTEPVQPPQFTAPDLADVVTVPFTAVIDNGLSIEQQIAQSPFYSVKREEVYELAQFAINNTPDGQQTTITEQTGVSTSDSSTFSLTTGISVTAESGVSFLGSGGKVSATLSVELGYQTSTNITEFVNQTVSQQYNIGARTAFAVWTKFDQITVLRMDDTPVSRSLAFRENVFVASSVPL